MKTFDFKQNDLKRGIPFAIIYLLVVFAGCYLYFGGFLGMANALDSVGSGRGIGLIIGVVVLGPFIILLTVLMPKVKLELGANALTISSNKNQKQIAYDEIYALQLNMNKLNRLDIIGKQNNVLVHIQPQSQPQILSQIIAEINNHIAFTKQTGSKSYFGTSVETALYIRSV